MCPFCDIARRQASADIVFADDASVAFLDHRPLFPGHCLLIPREHHVTLADLPPDQVGALFRNAQMLARVVEDALAAEGTFVALNNRVSQSVPHLHVHVVPRRRKDGLRGFFWPRRHYDDDDHRARVAGALRSGIERVRAPEVT
ncbi:HIT family protein [soil metagenome]